MIYGNSVEWSGTPRNGRSLRSLGYALRARRSRAVRASGPVPSGRLVQGRPQDGHAGGGSVCADAAAGILGETESRAVPLARA